MLARLQASGLTVVAAQIPLTSFAADVELLRRELTVCDGPVVLVGHAWGGTVITEVGDDPKVAALVYVAAFAPKIGESTNDLTQSLPVPGLVSVIHVDLAGYWRIPQQHFADHMAQDLTAEYSRVLAASQIPICVNALDARVTHAGWEIKPCWYLIAEADRMIDPALQRQMAVRMHATTKSVRSSHLPFITRPRETTAIILDAVNHIR